jgi:hypothetical protein
MDAQRLKGATFAAGNSLLTATGTETVHDSTVIMPFCIKGKAYTKPASNVDQATPTTDYNTAAVFPTLTANKGCVVVWAYNSSLAVKCMMGPIQDLDSAGNFKIPPQFPRVPDDVCPFAYQVLKAGSTAGNINFGTSNWDATGFTNVIQNILCMPDRPQIA